MVKLFTRVTILAVGLMSSGITYGESPSNVCASLLAPDIEGGQFLHNKTSTLHKNRGVELTSQHFRQQDGKSASKPAVKIATWLSYFELLNKRAQKDPLVLERIKKYYHNLYVVKAKDISQGYFDLQARIARERGEGQLKIDSDTKQELANIAIEDQKKSLDNWVQYFTSSDSDSYPMWAKYWAFKSVVALGKWDPLTGRFENRREGSAGPFPELNREALAIVVDAITTKVKSKNSEKIDDPEFQKVLEGANFAKIYGLTLLRVSRPAVMNEVTEGKWVTFLKGSDPVPLVESLKGMNTGWCTAGLETARSQLIRGDFHVYYSADEQGIARRPRIAIRMDGNKIGEVRGVSQDQNLDSYIAQTKILPEKLKSFGAEGDRYLKRSQHMAALTRIEKSLNAGYSLERDDLRFLYEIDEKIQGFGHRRDPRVDEFLKNRDKRKDLALVLNVKPEEISFSGIEALSGKIKFHYGNLDLQFLGNEDLNKWTFPEEISGNLDLSGITLSNGTILPRKIHGDLDLSELRSAVGTTFPKSVTGNVSLRNLVTIDHSNFFEFVGGDLYLANLLAAEELKFPTSVGGNLRLYKIESIRNTTFPKRVGGDLEVSLKGSPNRIVLPKSVGGTLALFHLTSAENITFPEFVGGDFYLSRLTTYKGLSLPSKIEGSTHLQVRPGILERIQRNISQYFRVFRKDSTSQTAPASSPVHPE